MTGEDIKALRKTLTCSARELATALGVDQKEVLAWEAGELFPTKRLVSAMQDLRDRGPTAIPRTTKGKSAKTGVDRLDDPKLWAIVKKLCAHPAFFDQVAALATQYDEPTHK